jgi:hypothetical protein
MPGRAPGWSRGCCQKSCQLRRTESEATGERRAWVKLEQGVFSCSGLGTLPDELLKPGGQDLITTDERVGSFQEGENADVCSSCLAERLIARDQARHQRRVP